MINNLYTKTISDIHATDIFKNRVIEAMESAQEQNSADHKKRKARPFVKWTAVAVVLVLAFCLGILVLSQLNEERGFINNGNIDTQLQPPYFMANGSTFWSHSSAVSVLTLPEGYVEYGKIKSYGGTYEEYDYGDLISCGYLHIGDPVYVNPKKPNAAYVVRGYSEEGVNCYDLFVTWDLLVENMIFYNGKLFYFGHYEDDNVDIKDILEAPENGYSVVGTIQAEVFDEFPSTEFQSNISGALGCNVYASQNMPDIIFLEFSDETIHGMRYMELRPR